MKNKDKLTDSLSPVLVEAAATILRHVLSPDGEQSAETVRGLNVADRSDGYHGRCLNDRDSLHDLLFVDL